MLGIISIIRQSEQGLSHPLLCRTDGDGVYWCKGWQASVDALRKELLCARIARELKLPIADFDILSCPISLADAWVKVGSDFPVKNELLVREGMTSVFGSLNLGAVNDMRNEKEIADEEFEEEKLKIALFDEFIQNLDRTEENSNILLPVDESKGFRMIDHNDAFSNGFSRDEFRARHIFRRAYEAAGIEKRNAIRERFSDVVNASLIQRIWCEMPDDWMSEEWRGITKEEITKTLTREWSE